MVYSVIGSNYGDEGKGLATDYLASRSGKVLVVRHNGGAQAGHTVEIGEKRFVFHELGSGSFRGTCTYWADSFFPDMYKLEEEVQSFCSLSGMIPDIYASGLSCMTTIDDILINMLLESGRGEQCHGSCGMGINEADLRKNAGFGITLDQLKVYSVDALFQELKRIRKEYSLCRLHEMMLDFPVQNEYFELLNDEAVLYNFAEAVIHNFRYITVVDDTKELFADYDTIIFEGAQGLRLDSEYEKNWPHVTASRTGLTNVLRILDAVNLRLDEVIYVTRSYVTKHGAGPLAYENSDLLGEQKIMDETNVHNRWQGSLRYSRWKDVDDFLEAIREDSRKCVYPVKRSLLITHLNETKNQMLFQSGDVDIMTLIEHEMIQCEFEHIYLSGTRFADDIRHDQLIRKVNTLGTNC
ncbi:MAG: adenylosuccinate synthetase [bacterium]|nr:adenylosuccinate synthetase [bacterium]